MGGKQSRSPARCCHCTSAECSQLAEDVLANKFAETEDDSDDGSSERSGSEAAGPSKRLQDSPQAATGIPGQKPGELFKVVLVKQGGLPLGIDVNHADKSTLTVVSVNYVEGLVLLWNRQYPDQAVKVGDRILSVNGIAGSAARMIEVCKTASLLHLVVRRA
mmetsp:Transcript_102890/g.288385  ORF Transcript_102890/g.288385 Transcript_102890/m.288385 type:complete len:162 (-) Transcript_102890:250-735(-)